jgi:hypothetical protein
MAVTHKKIQAIISNSHNLVEVQSVQQIIELAIFVLLFQHDVMLHKAVQCELGLIVNVDLHGLWNTGRQCNRLNFEVSLEFLIGKIFAQAEPIKHRLSLTYLARAASKFMHSRKMSHDLLSPSPMASRRNKPALISGIPTSKPIATFPQNIIQPSSPLSIQCRPDNDLQSPETPTVISMTCLQGFRLATFRPVIPDSQWQYWQAKNTCSVSWRVNSV